MSNIIDFHTGKPIEEPKAETTVEASESTAAAKEDATRRLNLIRRLIYEAIGTCLSEIDGEQYTFIDWIYDTGIFESDTIENGGYLNQIDAQFCYKIAEVISPIVDEFAANLKDIMIDSV